MLKEIKDILNLGAPFNLVIPKRTISDDEQMIVSKRQIVPGKIATIEAEIRPGETLDKYFEPVDVVTLDWLINGEVYRSRTFLGPEINDCADLKGRIRFR